MLFYDGLYKCAWEVGDVHGCWIWISHNWFYCKNIQKLFSSASKLCAYLRAYFCECYSFNRKMWRYWVMGF